MEGCIFCKLINGEIPSNKVLENDDFVAFHDIAPVMPVHVIVIPKHHVQSVAHITEENAKYIAGLLPFIASVAEQLGLQEDGYRIVFNTGEKAGQTVPHMHAHILGGKEMGWPNA